MSTRTKTKWSLDNQGQYARQIGWKRSKSGQRVQHKFRLGTDLTQAKIRELQIQTLWQEIESSGGGLWYSHTLEIAKQIAKGENQPVLAQRPIGDPRQQAAWFNRVQGHYPMLSLMPENVEDYQQASTINRDTANGQIADLTARYQRGGWLTEFEVSAIAGTLYQAFDAYMADIRTTQIEVVNPKPHGRTRVDTTSRLKERHPDQPLSNIHFDEIQALVDYWRHRPKVKGKNKPMEKDTCENHISELVRFFKWLHRTKSFAWRKPDDFSDLNCKVDETRAETQAKETSEQVLTWTVDELVVLYRYATPIERAAMLLGLNCGFIASEQGTLLVRQATSHIKRIRLKNMVYGEHRLWPTTVAGLQWLLARRESFGPTKPDDLVWVTEKLKPYWEASDRGSGRFGKMWNDLLDRVQLDHPSFRRLSFKILRKTASNMIRMESDGEIAKVFLCHGNPVGDELVEAYTNKPFDKVFAAIEKIGETLNPMFDAVPEPFAEHRKSYMGLAKSERILELYDGGMKLAGIVAELGIAPSTIYRTLEGAGRQTKRYSKKPR